MGLAELFDQQVESRRAAMQRLPCDGVRCQQRDGRAVLHVAPDALRCLAREAFRDANFLLRTDTLEQWNAILDDPQASSNDRFVAAAFLKNAAISAEGVLPLCQDTGTATVIAFKGESAFTGCDDATLLEQGIADAYAGSHLRFSQMIPLGMCDERNSNTNLPAQIDIYASAGDQYRFLFIVKGGGSANKTAFFPKTKALLNEESLAAFLREQVCALGVAACPPYHLALVVGGTSPEFNLKMLKLATAGVLDELPDSPDQGGRSYRDRRWEERLQKLAAETGLGAQFGGKYLAVDARVIRCSRHAGSCPVSLGVSCCAHRNILGSIGPDGVFLESLDLNPARFLPKALPILERATAPGGVPRVLLDRPIEKVCEQLGQYPVGTLVLLSGDMILARDMAHSRFHETIAAGRPMPDYLRRHPVFYAGPSEAPPGRASGSLGPTTSQRMDPYLPELMAIGLSRITVGKGNRTPAVADACRDRGGFYLATIGGAAALLAADCVVQSEVIDHADLGMEAVRRIEVRDLPAVVAIDDKGCDLYNGQPFIATTSLGK